MSGCSCAEKEQTGAGPPCVGRSLAGHKEERVVYLCRACHCCPRWWGWEGEHRQGNVKGLWGRWCALFTLCITWRVSFAVLQV
jgi:hypothetical protein